MLLLAHIFMGTGALLLGPVAMLARKARVFHSRVGEIYHALVLGVCVTAGALAILGWGRSAAFSPDRHRLLRLRACGEWLRIHIVGQGGSYLALGVGTSDTRRNAPDRLDHPGAGLGGRRR